MRNSGLRSRRPACPLRRPLPVGLLPVSWRKSRSVSNYHYSLIQTSVAASFVPLFGTDSLITSSDPDHLTQRAVFGELSYRLTDRRKATAGLRYYSYRQNGAFISSGIVTSTLTPIPVYVAASNSGTGRNTAPTQYNPNTVWSYELGEKATLLDRRLTLNSAIYHERWTDVQQEISLACGFGFVGNVGGANVRGAESWTFVQSGGLIHAVVASTPAGTSLLTGQQLLNVPTHSASTSLVYMRHAVPYMFVAGQSNRDEPAADSGIVRPVPVLAGRRSNDRPTHCRRVSGFARRP